MSRQKRNRQRRSAPVRAGSQRRRPRRVRLLVVAGLTAAAIVGAAWYAERTPVRRSGSGGVPVLVVTPETTGLGDRMVGEWASVSLQVLNAGTGPLRFQLPPWVTVAAGCCPPTARIGSMVLEPGERTTIDMRFTMHRGMDGPHDFRVHLVTDDPAGPDRTVRVLSNWVVPSAD